MAAPHPSMSNFDRESRSPDLPFESPGPGGDIELERMRRAVHAKLFDRSHDPLLLGRYALEQAIGHGGMGVVYRALDTQLDRRVAIKVLRGDAELDGCVDSGRHDGLGREAKALARLSHPNVVTVHDIGRHEGRRFVAMEFVEGCTLTQWLATPRRASAVVDVLIASGRGLAAAHEVGLVHGDFKTDNVLVGAEGRPRVLDFGLAKTHSDEPLAPADLPAGAVPSATALDASGRVIGTPAYMSPEQHLGQALDARSDQFSFGVACYFALYGRLPFEGSDLRTLSLAIVRGIPRARNDRRVPESLAALVQRCLSVAPELRFPDMPSLLAELERWQATHPEFAQVLLETAPSHAASAESMDSTNMSSAAWLPGARAAARLEPVTDTHARQAEVSSLARADVPTQLDQRLVPPPQRESGVCVTALAARMLPAMPSCTTIDVLGRELARTCGGEGSWEALGTSLIWSNSNFEVRLDEVGGDVQLVILRNDRKRVVRSLRVMTCAGMAGGILAAAVGGEFLVSIFPDAIMAVVIPGSLIGGALSGRRHSARRQHRRLRETQPELEHLADRLVALAASASARP